MLLIRISIVSIVCARTPLAFCFSSSMEFSMLQDSKKLCNTCRYIKSSEAGSIADFIVPRKDTAISIIFAIVSLWSLSTCVQILLLQQLQKMLLQVLLLIYNLLPSTIHTIHQVFNFNFNNWLFEELNHTPSWCSRVCRVQMRTLAGVSSLESAITLQLSRGLDSPTQTNFLLMRNICNEAGVCVTRTMTGGRCGVLQCRTVCWHDLHFHWFNPKEKEEF